MIELKLTGNTFGIKETLKGLGFKWKSLDQKLQRL